MNDIEQAMKTAMIQKPVKLNEGNYRIYCRNPELFVKRGILSQLVDDTSSFFSAVALETFSLIFKM